MRHLWRKTDGQCTKVNIEQTAIDITVSVSDYNIADRKYQLWHNCHVFLPQCYSNQRVEWWSNAMIAFYLLFAYKGRWWMSYDNEFTYLEVETISGSNIDWPAWSDNQKVQELYILGDITWIFPAEFCYTQRAARVAHSFKVSFYWGKQLIQTCMNKVPVFPNGMKRLTSLIARLHSSRDIYRMEKIPLPRRGELATSLQVAPNNTM